MPREISLEVTRNIARAEPFVFQASTRFDRKKPFSLPGIAHSEGRGDRSSADKRADLEDLSGTNFRKMIDQDQDVQMQHRVSIADFKQLRMNRLLPVLHQSMHQVEALVELAVASRESRSVQRRPGGPRWTMPSHHNEVPLCTIEPCNPRQQSPPVKAEPLK